MGYSRVKPRIMSALMKILDNFAKTYAGLADASQAYLREQVAGVFQANILPIGFVQKLLRLTGNKNSCKIVGDQLAADLFRPTAIHQPPRQLTGEQLRRTAGSS